MHSSSDLSSAMFGIEETGRKVASFAELCPGFTVQDRLGVVVREPLAATRFSAFILAAVTAFYDEQRKLASEFFIYPDYFVFHAGCAAGDYGMFDVWPQHKCVEVEDHPEVILRAVNDRGITLLLLGQPLMEHSPGRAELLQLHTRNSALARIRHAFVESTVAPAGSISITGNDKVERYVESVIAAPSGASDTEREAARLQRHDGVGQGDMAEWYLRLPVTSAINSV